MPETPLPPFAELEALRTSLSVLGAKHVASLEYYYDEKLPGFHHKHERPERKKISTSSTSTCVVSLVKANKWADVRPWVSRSQDIISGLLQQEWKSGGLYPDNPFAVSFVLEVVSALQAFAPGLCQQDSDRLSKAEQILLDSLSDGSVSLTVDHQQYPPSAYLTTAGGAHIEKSQPS